MFYKWLLSGISIAEHKRLLGESSEDNNLISEEEASTKSGSRQKEDAKKARRRNFSLNIQILGHNLPQEPPTPLGKNKSYYFFLFVVNNEICNDLLVEVGTDKTPKLSGTKRRIITRPDSEDRHDVVNENNGTNYREDKRRKISSGGVDWGKNEENSKNERLEHDTENKDENGL